MLHPPTFPVFLSLAGRRVLVVGGGPVGRRKAAAAADAGAAVQVVSLQPRPAGFDNPSVEWLAEPYRPAHLDGVMLVFAAGPVDVNAAVIADASARGVWACDAADPGRGSVVLPAVARSGRLTVAVGTGGASPALARRIAAKLRGEFDPAFAAWVDLLAEMRTEAKERIADAAARRAVLDALADWPWLDRVRTDGIDATREAMRAAVSREAQPSAEPSSLGDAPRSARAVPDPVGRPGPRPPRPPIPPLTGSGDLTPATPAREPLEPPATGESS